MSLYAIIRVAMDSSLTKASKSLSLVLRHQSEAMGLSLDEHGWAEIESLLTAARQSDNGVWLTNQVPVEFVAFPA